METISLTKIQHGRLQKVKKLGVKNKNFNPDSIDLTMNSFESVMENGKQISDAVKGFSRLIEQPKFVQRQIRWLKDQLNKYSNLNCRYLIRLPDNFQEYNELRTTFIKIQKDADTPKTYVFTGQQETFEAVTEYLDKLPNTEKFILVLDMGMDEEDLSKLIDKYVNICEEICFLYRDWNKHKIQFKLVLSKAEVNPNKFHMAFVPINLNSPAKIPLYPTALICSGFKSISIVDAEWPGYILKNIKRDGQPTPFKKKLSYGKWVNGNLMVYDKEHPDTCNCLNEVQDAYNFIRKCGIKEVLTFHYLETLSHQYKLIKSDEEKRKQVLELEPIRNLLNSLDLP